MTNGKRPLVRVALSDAALFCMLVQGWQSGPIRCVEGLPQGARFISSYFDAERNVALLVFEHESFPDVAPGEIIPERVIIFEQEVAA